MASVLVTGAAGFIGSLLSTALARAGYAVVGLDDLSGGFRRNVDEEAIEFLQGTVLDHDQVDWLFGKRRFDYVYHLAAYAAEGLSHFIRRFNYTNNLVGSTNLINASVKYGVKRFVFASSIAVYGSAAPPFNEGQHPTPADPYGIAKYAVELDLAAAHELFGLEYTIFRPHNVYGPHQHLGDRYRNVVGIFMNQLLRREPLTLFGDGLQTRAFSYVDDVLPPLIRCLAMPETVGQTYNLGSDTVYTVRAVADACKRIAGRSAPLAFLPARVEAQHAFPSHQKLTRVFGPAEETLLPTGLQRMWDWAQHIGPQEPSRFGALEVEKNLPTPYRPHPTYRGPETWPSRSPK